MSKQEQETRKVTRRDFLKKAVGFTGTVLASCTPTSENSAAIIPSAQSSPAYKKTLSTSSSTHTPDSSEPGKQSTLQPTQSSPQRKTESVPATTSKSSEQEVPKDWILHEYQNLFCKFPLPPDIKLLSIEEIRKLNPDLRWIIQTLGNYKTFAEKQIADRIPTRLFIANNIIGPYDVNAKPYDDLDSHTLALARQIDLAYVDKRGPLHDKTSELPPSLYIQPFIQKPEEYTVRRIDTEEIRIIKARFTETNTQTENPKNFTIDYTNIIFQTKVNDPRPIRGFKITLVTDPSSTEQQLKILERILAHFKILNKHNI